MTGEKVYLKIREDAQVYGSDLQSARGKVYPFTVDEDLYTLSSEDSGFEYSYTLVAESLELDTNDAPISVENRGRRDAYDYDEEYVGYESCYRDWETDRKSTRLNSSHSAKSRMPSSA